MDANLTRLNSKGISRFVKWMLAMSFLLILLLTQAKPAQAHLNTFGYSDITVIGNQIMYELYLDPTEVSQWMDLRSSGVFVLGENKAATKDSSEVAWTSEDLMPLVQESLIVKSGDQAAEPIISDISIQKRSSTLFLHMKLDYELPSDVESYYINYGFFYENDPGHQNFTTIRAGGSSKDLIFSRENHEITAQLNNMEASNMTTIEVPNWLLTMWDYIVVGIEHILGGTDHLLFILALVLVQQKKWNYLKVLTAFTVGHSLTIALAALEIVSLSPAFVEPVIALSIAYVAVENIWLKQVRWRWVVALMFGLIHGFGFAQVLQGALGDRFLLTLFSFNLGVELGQLAVLAVLLPLLLWAGRYKGYKYINYGVSGLISVIALYWFVTRIISG